MLGIESELKANFKDSILTSKINREYPFAVIYLTLSAGGGDAMLFSTREEWVAAVTLIRFKGLTPESYSEFDGKGWVPKPAPWEKQDETT